MPRMLIVDDEPDICDCLRTFFITKGFAVMSVWSGELALEQVMDDPPDVVLLDIRLPDLSGIEVLKRFRALCPDLPVVIVTAVDDDEIRVEAKVYGARGYVTKPFDFSDVTWASVFQLPA